MLTSREMRTSHVVSLCIAFVTSIALTAAGCGSSKDGSLYGDDGLGDGGSSSGSSGLGGFGDSGDARGCVGLECQIKSCSNGAPTSLSGIVYAPNGSLPLYNAIVYVPNSTPDTIKHGATCDQCGAVTGSPVTTALSNPDGSFTLKNMPSGKNIPLVIQVGKWRRQVVIPEVADCKDNQLSDPNLTRLPKNQTEGDIPHIALTTGGCDLLGCMLPKVGIDKSEFGLDGDTTKAVHVYNGNQVGQTTSTGPGAAQSAKNLWNNAAKLKTYDLTLLSCECNEARDGSNDGRAGEGPSKNATSFAAMTDYLTSGGRIFTSDFMYTWYKFSPNAGLTGAVTLPGGAPIGGKQMTIDTSFPKGKALGDWLNTVIPGSNDKVSPDVVYANISAVSSAAQSWAASGPGSDGAAGQRVFTVNVPTDVPAEQQCGRGVHLDAHLNETTMRGGTSTDVINANYPVGCGPTLTDGEKLLAFFFFDLASCIQKDTDTPQPPVVK